MILEKKSSSEEPDEISVEEATTRKRKLPGNNDDSATKKKKNLYAQPTVAELNQLRETQNLFNSNLFRLQIEEILKEIRKTSKVQTKTLKKQINQIPESSQYELTNLKFTKKWKTKLPIEAIPQERGFFQYLKPSNTFIEKKYGIDGRVDLYVQIPLKCFHKTDVANGAFLLKRALYLAYIANHLNNCSFTYLEGNILKPILKLDRNIYVHTTVEKPICKLSKLNPSKSNIYGGFPTPFYNSCLLQDFTKQDNLKLRDELLENLENVHDGIKLLEVWLKQRELLDGFGGFSMELMIMFVVYLVKMKKVNNAMSSYQVIRNVWINLAESKWSEVGGGISLYPDAKSESQPSLDEFHKHYPVVFVDVTGHFNLTSFLNKQIYEKVKSESKKAMEYLDDGEMNSFRALFTTKMQFHLQHDQILQITSDDLQKKYEKNVSEKNRIDHLSFKYPATLKNLTDILIQGLNNRIVSLTPKLYPSPIWSSTTKPPSPNTCITIGFDLDPQNAFSIIDIGPPANLPEAIPFRKFWGEKSQLRRFNDGNITEAIVWRENATNSEKRSILVEIINYLLEKKMGITNGIEHLCDELTELLSEGETITTVVNGFDELSKMLRNLKGLPLEVSAVYGCSSIFRYTDVQPGVAKQLIAFNKDGDKYKREVFSSIEPFEGVIHLALSNKWPNDLEAIKKLKTAFYIKIARLLESEHQLKCIVHLDFIDMKKDNCIFRIRIANNKEISLYKKMVDDEGVIKYRDTPESAHLEKNLIHLPILTSALSGLQSQFYSFGTAARLSKLWLRSQLLDDSHIPDVVVDLLIASLYTAPQPYDVPNQPQVAFLRFLQKMMQSDWELDPLIVNFNGELSNEKLSEADSYFNKNRTTLPPLFIVTPYDQTNSIWTKTSPSKQILLRIAVLAKESLNLLEKHLAETNDLKVLFNASSSGYDVKINLKPLTYAPVDDQKLNLLNAAIGEDFYQLYLKELREAYDELALFFHNPYNGNVINALWKPKALERKEFKVSHLNGRKLVLDKDPELVVNKEAILEDFQILGNDVVNSVESLK